MAIKLGSAYGKVSIDTKGAIRGVNGLKGVLGGLKGVSRLVGSAVRGVGIAVGIATAAVGFATSAALKTTAEYERMGMAIESLIAREIKNSGEAKTMAEAYELVGDRAKKLLEWTQELAIKSPFDQMGVAEAFKMAMAYGFTADEAQRLTQATIDFAAGAGRSSADMKRIALALGQIRAKGKLAGQEVMQLTEVGISVHEILSKAWGISTAELIKMQEQGLIPAKRAIEAITKSMEEDFGGAAARQTETWAGLINTFGDLKDIGLRELFKGVFDALKPVVVAYSEWLQSEGLDRIRTLGARLGQMMQMLIDKGPAVIDFFKSLKKRFDNLKGELFGDVDFGSLLERARALWVRLQDGFALLKERISSHFDFDNLKARIKNVADGIRLFFGGTTFGETMRETFDKVSESLLGLAGKAVPWLLTQWEKLTVWINVNKPLMEAFFAVMGERWAYVVEKIVAAWAFIEPILTGLVDLLLGIGKTVMQMATGDWAGAWLTMKETGKSVFKSLERAWIEYWNWILGFFGSSWDEFFEAQEKSHAKLFKSIDRLVRRVIEVWSGVDWQQLGKNILIGLTNGILGGIPAMVAAMISAGRLALSAIDSVFDNGSPSREMHKRGKWAGQGWIGGADESMNPNEIAKTFANPVLNRTTSQQQSITNNFASGLSVKQTQAMIDVNLEKLIKKFNYSLQF